jgi:hypothetical protein
VPTVAPPDGSTALIDLFNVFVLDLRLCSAKDFPGQVLRLLREGKADGLIDPGVRLWSGYIAGAPTNPETVLGVTSGGSCMGAGAVFVRLAFEEAREAHAAELQTNRTRLPEATAAHSHPALGLILQDKDLDCFDTAPCATAEATTDGVQNTSFSMCSWRSLGKTFV